MTILIKSFLFLLLLLLFNTFRLLEGAEALEDLESFDDCLKHRKNVKIFETTLITDKFDLIKSVQVPVQVDTQGLKLFIFGAVPSQQFHNFWIISLSTFLITKFWDEDGYFYEFIRAVSVFDLIYSLPKYFGYRPVFTLKDGNGKRYFTFMLEKLNFNPVPKVVSFERWLFTPILWVCIILLCLKDETFKILENQFNFPKYHYVKITAIMTTLLATGLFDVMNRFVDNFMEIRNKKKQEETSINK